MERTEKNTGLSERMMTEAIATFQKEADAMGFTPEERAEMAAYFINLWIAWAMEEKEDE